MTNPKPNPVGRPAIHDEPMVKRDVSMTAAQWEKVHQLGGSYSAGVRLAVDAMEDET
jgi:hypothetical protein